MSNTTFVIISQTAVIMWDFDIFISYISNPFSPFFKVHLFE
jgi:hypothetical protein